MSIRHYALRVKIRDEAVIRSKAVFLALAVLRDGTRDVLGIWIEQTEGAKFWMKVFTDLKTRFPIAPHASSLARKNMELARTTPLELLEPWNSWNQWELRS